MNQLEEIVGGLIVQAGDEDVDFGFTTEQMRRTPTLFISKGTKVFQVVILQDYEGNGPGAADVTERNDLRYNPHRGLIMPK